MKKLYLICVIPSFVFAHTLNELVEMSFNNKLIESSKMNIESTQYEYESVKAKYLPQLSLGAKYQLTNKETSSVADNINVLYAEVDYNIYDGGKRENTFDSYESDILSAKENLSDLKNKIALEVVNYYYSYMSLSSQKEAKLKHIEQLQAQHQRLQKFLEAGKVTNDEVDKIVSRVQSANVNLHEIELNIQTILHNLEYLVGKKVSVTGTSKIEEYIEQEDNGIRSDLKALKLDTESLLYKAKAQKSDYFPSLNINDTYYRYDLNYKTLTYNGLSDEYTQNLISLNLSWNIFGFGTTKKAYESAYKKYTALKSKFEYEKNKASVDLKLAKKALEIGKLKILSAEAALKAADSTYVTIKNKYQNGLVDNVAYLEALSEKYSAISQLKDATYDLEIKKTNIIYHSGKNIEEYIK
ncbi:TolC family protein [Sulfurimonas lithotrophica]|uniref:TolC family protein n=1 Tax=Sulfurimonas lithotrophica TaxID=2590022 RepID=A0A5P8P3Z9_9BACT|nr:TolC family protein [Sulfurimonas lithotrophica]